jgi:hypothetical protein
MTNRFSLQNRIVLADGSVREGAWRYSHGLKHVKESDAADFARVFQAITKIYNCEPHGSDSAKNIVFKDHEGKGRPIEIILLAIKWLFIEQDILVTSASNSASVSGEPINELRMFRSTFTSSTVGWTFVKST